MGPVEFTIPAAGGAASTASGTSARWYPAGAPAMGATLVLAHGAGAPQTHPWMVETATALAAKGLDVVTFNFPFAEAGRRLPDRAAVLEACWLAVIETVAGRPDLARRLFVGGKSLGGRMVTHLAARCDLASRGVAGLVLLGYPLHPSSRPERRRDAHLARVALPMLFVQGSRDPFGSPGAWQSVVSRLEPRATLLLVLGGDHSLLVPKQWPRPARQVLDDVWTAVADWIRARL